MPPKEWATSRPALPQQKNRTPESPQGLKRDSKFPQKTLRETGEPGWVTAAGVPAAEASQAHEIPLLPTVLSRDKSGAGEGT
jgi:hypothetical protein